MWPTGAAGGDRLSCLEVVPGEALVGGDGEPGVLDCCPGRRSTRRRHRHGPGRGWRRTTASGCRRRRRARAGPRMWNSPSAVIRSKHVLLRGWPAGRWRPHWHRMRSSSSQDGCKLGPGAATVAVRTSVERIGVRGTWLVLVVQAVDRCGSAAPAATARAPPPATASGGVRRTERLSDGGALQITHVLRREGLAADPPIAAVHLLDRDPGDGAHGLALDLDHGVGQLLDHLSASGRRRRRP